MADLVYVESSGVKTQAALSSKVSTPKILAEGQLPNTQTAIYTVPASTTTLVRRLDVFNTNAATQTVQIFLNTNGSARLWKRFLLAQNESAEVLSDGEELELEAGDIILAQTTTATAANYSVDGVETA